MQALEKSISASAASKNKFWTTPLFSADDLDLEEVIFIGFWVKIDKNSFLTTPTFDLDLLSDDLDL